MRARRGLFRDYPDETLLEEVRRVAEIVDKPVLSFSEFKKHSDLPTGVFARRFGTWLAVLQQAGLGQMYRGIDPEAITDEQLLDEVRRVAQLVTKPTLTVHEFSKHSAISTKALRRRFGDWRDVLERAGLEHRYSGRGISARLRVRRIYTDKELLAELQSVARLVKKSVLKIKDFQQHSTIPAHTISRHFGSWQGALTRAGLQHMYVRPYLGNGGRKNHE